MEKWHCFKCGVEMAEDRVSMEYLGTTQDIEGIRCPKCGVVYLLEETAEKVNNAEQMIETK